MELTVKLVSGEWHNVSVSADATVGELKRAVAQSFNVAASHVRLSTGDELQVRLQNELTPLSSYGLSSGSTVMLLLLARLQLFIKSLTGQTTIYDMTEEETVDELQKKIYNKEKILVDYQRLFFGGRQLQAGMKLKDYGIVDGSTIHLVLRLRG